MDAHSAPPRRPALVRRLIQLFALWGLLSVGLVGVFVVPSASAPARAVYGMALGLLFVWVILGGLLQLRLRDPISAWVRRLPGDWRVKFVLFCIVMALLEEAVTTTMTNLAPLFGVAYGEAYITASGNYLDVVLFHSVITFVPLFIGWSYLLSRFTFRPPEVFLLFGLTGTLAEALSFGLDNLLNFGFWTFVYGLMVYLPACSLPDARGARPPSLAHYPLALGVPLAFSIFYLALLWLLAGIFGVEMHPPVHFPPIAA